MSSHDQNASVVNIHQEVRLAVQRRSLPPLNPRLFPNPCQSQTESLLFLSNDKLKVHKVNRSHSDLLVFSDLLLLVYCRVDVVLFFVGRRLFLPQILAQYVVVEELQVAALCMPSMHSCVPCFGLSL